MINIAFKLGNVSIITREITCFTLHLTNPNYWIDPTGLFEDKKSAMDHIDAYGLKNAKVDYNENGYWQITSGGFTFYQSGNDLVLRYLDTSTGGVTVNTDGVRNIDEIAITESIIKNGGLGGFRNGYAGGYDVWGYLSLSPGQGVLNYTGHLETLTAVGYVGLSYVKDIDPKVLTGFSNASRHLGKFGYPAAAVNTYMDYENPEVSTTRFGYRLTGTITSFAVAGKIGGQYGVLAGAVVGALFGLGEMAYDSVIDVGQQIKYDFNRFYNQATRGARRF